jgi:hypothetical protein
MKGFLMGYIKNTSSEIIEFAAAGIRFELGAGRVTNDVPALTPYECNVLERTEGIELSSQFDLIQWMGEVAVKIAEKEFPPFVHDEEIAEIDNSPEDEEIIEDTDETVEDIDETVLHEDSKEVVENEVIDDETIDENPDDATESPEWIASMDTEDPIGELKKYSSKELKSFCLEAEKSDEGNKTELAQNLIDWYTEQD